MHRWSEERRCTREGRVQHTQGHSKPSFTTGPHYHLFPSSLLLDSRPSQPLWITPLFPGTVSRQTFSMKLYLATGYCCQ